MKSLLALCLMALLAAAGCRPAAPSNAPAPSLAADAGTLTAPPGKWQSEVLKITTRDGNVQEQVLVIEFAPVSGIGQSNAPDAQAKLLLSSPLIDFKGIAKASVDLGNANFRDVRLRETNGVRTITITRAVDASERDPAKTQRIYERFYSVSLRYELKNQVLTLKGFPTTNKVSWGVSEFIVPQEEIRFKRVK